MKPPAPPADPTNRGETLPTRAPRCLYAFSFPGSSSLPKAHFNLSQTLQITVFNLCKLLISRLCTTFHVNKNFFPNPPLPPSANSSLNYPVHPNSRQRFGMRRSHVALLLPSPTLPLLGQIKDRSGHITQSTKTALPLPTKKLGFKTHESAHFKRTDNASKESTSSSRFNPGYVQLFGGIGSSKANSQTLAPFYFAQAQNPFSLSTRLVFPAFAPATFRLRNIPSFYTATFSTLICINYLNTEG